MKKNHFISLACLSIALCACQENFVTYNEGYDNGLTPAGAPHIEYVSITGSSEPITQADMGQMLTIHGTNLSQVKELTCNGLPVDLRQIYAVNSGVTFPVPRQLFDESQADGKIILVNSKGTAEIALKVDVPNLAVDGFYCEYAAPGDTLEVTGDNFDLFELQTSGIAGIEGTDVQLPLFDVTQKSFRIFVPEDTPDDVLFTVTSDVYKQRKGDTPVKFYYRHEGVSFMHKDIENDPDGYGKFDNWGDGDFRADGTKAGEPKALPGIPWYIRVAGTFDKDGEWIWAGGLNVTAEAVTAFNGNISNHLLEFEVLTKQPFNTDIMFQYGNIQTTVNPGSPLTLDTYGQWKTFRMDPTAIFSEATEAGTWKNFAFWLVYSKTTPYDISFCNFRLVKKLNQ